MKQYTRTIWFQALAPAAAVLSAILFIAYPWGGTAKIEQPQSVDPKAALERGQNYLLDNFDSIQPQQRLILDYLYRKFSLNEQFSAAKTPMNASLRNAANQQEFESIKRFAYPDVLVSDLGLEPSLVARAANCDRIPLPPNTEELLKSEVDQGGYQLTHAALSLQLIKELGCSLDMGAEVYATIQSGMAALAENTETKPDLRYESIAFLMYLGHRDKVKETWIHQIITEQQPDGSWLPGSGIRGLKDHTTVLALWALLEYINPHAKDEPIIHLPD